MRVPSVKRLLAAFPNLDTRSAELIRALGRAAEMSPRGVPDPLESLMYDQRLPGTAHYVRSLHNDPWRSDIWRVTVALQGMNEVMGTFGVESLGPPRSGDYAPPYEYLNVGDPYVTTLIYRRRDDTLNIGSWGDVAERHPSWP